MDPAILQSMSQGEPVVIDEISAASRSISFSFIADQFLKVHGINISGEMLRMITNETNEIDFSTFDGYSVSIPFELAVTALNKTDVGDEIF